VNVRYASAPDGENHWDLRKDFLLEVLKEGNYDFIGGQEVLTTPDARYNQVKYYFENLPNYGILFQNREKEGVVRGEGTPVFYRMDRWRLDPEDYGSFWLSDTPSVQGSITWEGQSTCPRVCTGGLFHEIDKDGKLTGKTIYVYSTHFDHVGEIPRQKAAAVIFDKIANRKDKNAPVVLIGDFNCGENSPAIRFLKGETVTLGGEEKVPPMSLIDTFRVVHPDEQNVATFNGFRTGEITGAKIDYIFVTPDMKTTEAEIIRTSRDGKYPTDHFPVRATVEF
jgi:endonuclease/exonuclease/phosphatase family metal-dependent hydrolase